MQALILAAGKGKRLRPLTADIPKAMINIAKKPMIEYHIRLLKKYGIKDIFVNLYTMPQLIINYFKDGKKFNVHITYSREDTRESYKGPLLLGSAGALHNFKNNLRDDFFILCGDVFIDVDLSKMLSFHKKHKSLFTIAVHEASHPKDSDLVLIGRNNTLLQWIRTPHNYNKGISNAGLYIMNVKLLQSLPKKVPCDLAHDFIPYLLTRFSIYTYHTKELMMDIGIPQRYEQLKKIIGYD